MLPWGVGAIDSLAAASVGRKTDAYPSLFTCRQTPKELFPVIHHLSAALQVVPPSTMSSPQATLQSPVTLVASEPSLPEDHNRHASLCELCLKCHNAALRDDGRAWIKDENHARLRIPIKDDIQTLPMDEWPKLPRLLNSARAGCAFCAVLREAILSHKFNDAWEHLSEGNVANFHTQRFGLEFFYSPEISAPCFSDPTPLGFLIVRVTFEKGSTVCLRFQVEAITSTWPVSCTVIGSFTNFCFDFTGFKAVAEWLALMPPATQNYDDDEITSFLTRKLQEHPANPESGHENRKFVPERLIDVGGGRLRLVDRKDIIADPAIRPQYCALSYCWGPSEDAVYQTKTTRKNIERNLESMDFDDLSPVLKDAVTTARSLSIPYLWVDALCILQDDMSDWQMQCSQMNDIYGGACVTFIAASSRTCREAFLNPNRLGLQIPYRSARRPDISGYFTIYFTHAFNGIRSFINKSLINDLHIDLTFSQWARRGWTFQEDAMAGARIIYGNAGVYFAQETQVVSKHGAAGFFKPKVATSLQSKSELHGAWEHVVLRYANFTNASFTNPRDVLPALSGLARLFGNILQEKYVAGHWVDRLHLSLMWGYISDAARPSLNDITERQSQRTYLIPTWSCLTRGRIDTRRAYDSSETQSQIRILDIHMELDGTDPYGAIRDARLTLEGFVLDLASLSWSKSPDRLEAPVGSHGEQIWFSKDPRYSEGPWHYNQFVILNPHAEISLDDSITLDSAGKRREMGAFQTHSLELDFKAEPRKYSLLGTLEEPCYHLISRATLLLLEGDATACGLVLIPYNGVSERSFLRIGIFSSKHSFSSQSQTVHKPFCLNMLMKRETITLL